MKRLYVGCRKDGHRELFRSDSVPSYKSHGDKYFAAIGPFRTIAGAHVMAEAQSNPHCMTVADAERIAASK